MQDRKNRWQYVMVLVLMMVLALAMVGIPGITGFRAITPVYAADITGDNISGKWLTVSGTGDGTGGRVGWGTMQMINTTGLNAYYASIGDLTLCTWEFHPSNDINNGWSFGAVGKTTGRDLETRRKVAGIWLDPDLKVDFDSGRVGINTSNPDTASKLKSLMITRPIPSTAVYGQTPAVIPTVWAAPMML